MCRHYAELNAFACLPPLAMAPNDESISSIRGHLAAMNTYKFSGAANVV